MEEHCQLIDMIASHEVGLGLTTRRLATDGEQQSWTAELSAALARTDRAR